MCIYTLSVSVQPVPQSSFGVTMAAVFQTPRNVMVLITDITSSDEHGCGRYHTILHEVVTDIKLINVWLILPCQFEVLYSLLYCFHIQRILTWPLVCWLQDLLPWYSMGSHIYIKTCQRRQCCNLTAIGLSHHLLLIMVMLFPWDKYSAHQLVLFMSLL